MAKHLFDGPELDVAGDNCGLFWCGVIKRLTLWTEFLVMEMDRDGFLVVLAVVEDRHGCVCLLSKTLLLVEKKNINKGCKIELGVSV